MRCASRRPRPPLLRWTSHAAAMCTVAAALIVVAGCGSSHDDAAPNVPTVTPASAPVAPNPSAPPAGRVIPTAPGGRDLAVDDGEIAILEGSGTQVLRFQPGAVTATATLATTPPLTRLVGGGGGTFLGAGPGVIVRIGRDGAVHTANTPHDNPTALAQTGDGRVLVGTADGKVLVFDHDLRQQRVITGFVRVDAITVSGRGARLPHEQVVVLDRAQSSVTPINLADGSLGPALRAGNGATNAVKDHYGRILVTNTRDGELIGFFGSSLVMRFRYPVAGGPYAVDYDDAHNLAWVSTTANNEVVAYDLAGGEPVQKRRLPTVAQPDNIAVDDATGTVYVLSARGGLQIIAPGS